MPADAVGTRNWSTSSYLYYSLSALALYGANWQIPFGTALCLHMALM